MRVGEMVGDYEIVRPLGEGGMATVFVARDVRHDREVVLKALPPYLNSPSMEARFKREIQSIAQLSHPNVVKVLDFSVTSTLAWYVMPFVPAIDLEKYGVEVRAGAMAPPPSALSKLRSIILDVASALAHCHERGVYHRDIKPQNILVELENHRGVMSDFGLARAENLTNLTKSREMLGTLRYMSPEMLKGGAEAGGSSDVYQLALVTYEVLAGQLPFTCSNPYDELKRLHSEPIPSIRVHNPAVAEELSEFVVRGFHPDPEQRPSTMEVYLEGLKSLPVEYRTHRSGAIPKSVTMALSRSQELSQGIVQAELKRRRRTRTASIVGVAAALVLAAGFLIFSRAPRGFAVRASYQDAQVTATGGPRFSIELTGGAGMRVLDAQFSADRGWTAAIPGLAPGQSYTATWILEDGRRGPPVEFKTKEIKLGQVHTAIDGQRLKVAFDSSAPVRARLVTADDTGVELDRDASTQHQGEVPLKQVTDPELHVAVTDAAGDSARLDLGPIALPPEVAADVIAAIDLLDIDKFYREVSLPQWRRQERATVAKHLQESMLRRVLAVTDVFRPVAALYFASPTTPLATRMATYAAVSKLNHAECLVTREAIPLSFDIPSLLGPLAPRAASSLTGASALSIQLLKLEKFKLNATGDLRKLNASAYDAVDAGSVYNSEVVVDREIRNTRDLKKAELALSMSDAQRDVYFSVEINGRYRLLFFLPGYARVSRDNPPVVLHHAFDPALLEDGHNRFRVTLRVVADIPWSKGYADVSSLELRAQ